MIRSPRILASLRGQLPDSASPLLAFAKRTLARQARLAGLGAQHEISLTLCDNATMRRINCRWRAIDAPTDVLSFPQFDLRPGQMPLASSVGDIIISLPYCRRAAAELNLSMREHLAHLLVHGLLHLLGYDHQSQNQYRRMRRTELQLLRNEPLNG